MDKNWRCIGDHRSLYIFILITDLLGEDLFHIHRSSARQLIWDQPKVVSKYNALFNQQLKSQRTFQKFNILESNIKEKTTDVHTIILLDNLSKIQQDAQKKDAESLNMDLFPTSLSFQKLENPYTYGIMSFEKKGQKTSTRFLKRLSKKLESLIQWICH